MPGDPVHHGERIAVLENQVNALLRRYDRDVGELKGDMKILLGKFDNMSGGQKAWFALFTIVGTIIGSIGTGAAMLATLGHSFRPPTH